MGGSEIPVECLKVVEYIIRHLVNTTNDSQWYGRGASWLSSSVRDVPARDRGFDPRLR